MPVIRSRIVILIIALAMMSGDAGAGARPAAPAVSMTSTTRSPLLTRVDDSIARGVRYLLARQNSNGTWGEKDDHPIGQTALVTLSLLSCGESNQSPAMLKAINYLKANRPKRTYDLGLHACVFASLPAAARADVLANDLRLLLSSAKTRPESDDGLYTYAGGLEQGADYSNSQYGVLGVWYAQSLGGLEVPSAFWKRVENSWKRGQVADGGWGYTPNRNSSSYASMTAAGAATLFITNDYLHAEDAHDLNIATTNAALDRAVAWLGDHFAVDLNVGMDSDERPRKKDDEIGKIIDELGGGADRIKRRGRSGSWLHYMLFGYERVGEASGLTQFGEHNWFEEGAQFLMGVQDSEGSWDGTHNANVSTAYSLLFLSRGRSPVLIQKLQFGDEKNRHWNNRPRDAANYVRFMRHATERHVNWQVVSADAPLNELRDAPMLYLASDRPIKLTDAQKQSIKAYVDEGGLLVLSNDGATDAFARSAVALCKELWPDYAMRELPGDHVIRSGNFPLTNWQSPIHGLSNGVRELVVFFPTGDASWRWQSSGGAVTPTLSPFAPLANLYLYLTDKSAPRDKGETTWIDRDSSADPALDLHVARLRYAGNWNAEPLGWQRLANLLHNTQDADVVVHMIDPTELKNGFAMAHLSATGSFDLTKPQRDALKLYLDRGGLLLFDAAGGSSDATFAFETLMTALYPTVRPVALPQSHPIYAGNFKGGRPITEVKYRRAPKSNLPPSQSPRLRGYTINGKLCVLESPEDISAALAGYAHGGITGYSAASGAELMRNVLLWSATRK